MHSDLNKQTNNKKKTTYETHESWKTMKETLKNVKNELLIIRLQTVKIIKGIYMYVLKNALC